MPTDKNAFKSGALLINHDMMDDDGVWFSSSSNVDARSHIWPVS